MNEEKPRRSGVELVRPGKSRPVADVRVYKATTDESGGYIWVKAVNADGSVTGAAIQLRVLP